MTQTYINNKGQNYRQGTVTATDEVIQLDQLLTWGYIGIQVTGVWTGTLNFEATVDGVTWVALPCIPIAGGAAVSSATANGVWTVQNTGFPSVRVRFNPATSGTPTISIRSLPSQV